MSSSPFLAQVTAPCRSSQGYSSLVGSGSGCTVPALDPRPPPRIVCSRCFREQSDVGSGGPGRARMLREVGGVWEERREGARTLGSDTQVYREGRGRRPRRRISSYFSFLFLPALLLFLSLGALPRTQRLRRLHLDCGPSTDNRRRRSCVTAAPESALCCRRLS